MIVWSSRISEAWTNLGVILIKMRSRETMFGEFGSAKSLGQQPQLLPYGVPLSIGSLIVLSDQVFGWWMV